MKKQLFFIFAMLFAAQCPATDPQVTSLLTELNQLHQEIYDTSLEEASLLPAKLNVIIDQDIRYVTSNSVNFFRIQDTNLINMAQEVNNIGKMVVDVYINMINDKKRIYTQVDIRQQYAQLLERIRGPLPQLISKIRANKYSTKSKQNAQHLLNGVAQFLFDTCYQALTRKLIRKIQPPDIKYVAL